MFHNSPFNVHNCLTKILYQIITRKCQLFDFLFVIIYYFSGPSERGGLMPQNKFSYEKLSPHFTFEELTKTSKAPYKLLNCLLAKQYTENLMILTNYLLEPARAIINTPLIITSGYRCLGLNKEISGSNNSQHLNGTAADFVLDSKYLTLENAFTKLKESPFLHYGQLILEKNWIHLSLGVPFRELNKCCESFKIL